MIPAGFDELATRFAAIVAKLGLVVSGGILGAGSWLIAQAGASDLTGELVGGGILTGVGLIALRLVLNAARYERESAKTNEERLTRRISDLEADLGAERKRAARLLIGYDQERALRLSLEAAGAHDRRRHPPAYLDPATLVDAGDAADLADEVAAVKAEIPPPAPDEV